MVDVPEGLDDKGKVEWARLELLTIYDAEVARLDEVRAAFDPAALRRTRRVRATAPSSTPPRR